MVGEWGGGIRNELTNLAAAANTVVETDMAFLCLFGFLLQLYHEPGRAEPGWAGLGVCKGEGCSDEGWIVGTFPSLCCQH